MTDTSVRSAVQCSREELFQSYRDIGAAEAHFNRLQSHYRLLASTWILASLGGIGFVFTEADALPVAAPRMAAFISFIAAVGTLLLWVVDMRVYQKLLGANYVEGLAMESAFAWLPQIRTRIRRQFAYRLPMMISLFYLAQSELLWGMTCVFYYSDAASLAVNVGGLLPLYLPGAVLIAALILSSDLPARRKTRSTEVTERTRQLTAVEVIGAKPSTAPVRDDQSES